MPAERVSRVSAALPSTNAFPTSEHPRAAGRFVAAFTPWLMFISICLLALFPYPGQCEEASKDSAAVDVLWRRLREKPPYSDTKCIFLMEEEHTARQVIVAVREKHDETCGGDPEVAPLLDRFRVSPKTGVVEWYDALEDDYRPYSEFLKSRQAK